MIGTKYKQTEVGIIPADWDVTSIENTCNCYAGATPSTSNPNYWAGGNIPWMSSGEVNYRRIYATECHITKLGFDNSSTKWVPKHSVVMALAGQGKTRGMVAINEIELCTNQSLCAIVPQSHLNYLSLYYNLYSRYNELREISGDARSGLNLFLIKNIHIPLPSSEEQKCIAQSLSDMDALLVSLDKLIAKKKAIKQGSMQQLLIGKQRLKGYDKPWVSFRIEELFDLGNGYTPSKEVASYWNNGTIPWFRMEDIRTNGRILKDSIQHITKKAVKGGGLFPAGSFILSTTATIGEHALLIADSLANQQFTFLNRKVNRVSDIDQMFFFHYLFIIGDWCRANINDGGLLAVNMTDLKNYECKIPPTLDEQCAIASILTDMDAEITELESKKAKYTAIKQGMMQQLLTGKIRLI